MLVHASSSTIRERNKQLSTHRSRLSGGDSTTELAREIQALLVERNGRIVIRPLQVTFWFLVHRPHHIFWLKIPHYFYCACAVKRKEKRKKTKLIPHGEFLKLKLSKYLNVSIFFNQLKRKAYKFKLVSTTYIGYSFYRGVNSRLLCHVYDKLLCVQSVFKQNITSYFLGELFQLMNQVQALNNILNK